VLAVRVVQDRGVRAPFVPEGFTPPGGLRTETFVLEPLGPEHNERDHAAWTSSMEHIRATPGWGEREWPVQMTLEENLADMEMHARHFADREGFTYTVLDPGDGDVIGCVYIYPPKDDAHDANVQSWVRASHSHLDSDLWRTVSAWLDSDAWPFSAVRYAPREGSRRGGQDSNLRPED
jgi:RimJ/RimL family protein N-acetyltransferase